MLVAPFIADTANPANVRLYQFQITARCIKKFTVTVIQVFDSSLGLSTVEDVGSVLVVKEFEVLLPMLDDAETDRTQESLSISTEDRKRFDRGRRNGKEQNRARCAAQTKTQTQTQTSRRFDSTSEALRRGSVVFIDFRIVSTSQTDVNHHHQSTFNTNSLSLEEDLIQLERSKINWKKMKMRQVTPEQLKLPEVKREEMKPEVSCPSAN
ncbi:hypothetical protein BY996DRAFT_6514859 [Phakopsora pachyrhizi]|nr:hypothetical protein BY996DRAFT_6514859 [Phakopsora pachyrhizi]